MEDAINLQKALKQAKDSFDEGGVPIGAILVSQNGEIIAEGHNENKQSFDPTAHAEIVCMRKAGKKVLKKFSPEPTILYTTLEPCFACGFFLTRTNIQKVVWALNDPYNGAMEFLRTNEKLALPFEKIEFVSEPIKELKKQSKDLLKKYYENKGEIEIAKLFE
jgi:tRNA(Arg) A34 adenosine deaminase TadA